MAKNFYKYIYDALKQSGIADGKIFVSDTLGNEHFKKVPYIFVTEISEKIFPNSVRSARFQIDIFGGNIEETIKIRQQVIKIFHKKENSDILSEMIETHGIEGITENLVRSIVDFRFVAKDSNY